MLGTLQLAGLKNACYFRALEGLTGHCVCRKQALQTPALGTCLAAALCYFLFLASDYECVDLRMANEKLHKEGFSR